MLFYLSYMLDSFVMIYEVLYVDAEEPIRDYIRSETDYYDLWDNQDFWDKIYEDQTYLMSITCESVSEIIESYITPARTLLTYAKEDLYHIMNSFQADPYSYFEESHGGGYTEITPGTCTHEKCQICGGCLDKSTIACEPCTCPSLTLTVSSSTVTINESVTLTTTSVAENTACTFQIRGDSIQEDIAYVNGTSYTFTPRVSGVFWLRVKQSFYGRDFYSDEVKLEVQYPSYDDIVSDSSVIQKMEILWSSTKYSTTPITVKEYGCWIYWDSQTASYDFQIVEGEAVSPPLVPSVSTPNTTLTRTVDALVGTEKTLVAIFHTHTPLTYYDGNHIRLVGPSSNDLEAIKNDNVVGIVYDYVGENGELKSGHNINDSAKLYHFGEERRPTRTKFY